MENIVYIEINSELGAGTRGASLGVEALRVASWNAGSTLLNKYPVEKVPNRNELLWEPNPTPNGIHIAGILEVYRNMARATTHAIKNEKFPVVLAGDHSTAGATIAGIKKAKPDARIGVVWVDAHGDMHTPYTTPSGNVHGMPLATALNYDNQENAINEVSEEEQGIWEEMKNLGGIAPKIEFEDLVFVGVRDIEEPEEKLMNTHQIRNYTVAEVNAKGAKAIGEQVLAQLEGCDHIYISFDVDSMDADLVSEGTGTPVKDGLSAEQAGELLETLVQSPKLIAFEMVEINPCLDNKRNKMAETALEQLSRVIKVLEEK